ncbi:MAG: hypothetical protein COU69_00730 [Candidatus Pacebacteria bacterium CG10_big_fil_rev_8_21_14_0_10_56_10]|nr:MAG: hypothetical protein COU69_00730 [Candidatus Pacebacteria bacterium CG10_big_fil_rev_8_21_14_0_10_56_10]
MVALLRAVLEALLVVDSIWAVLWRGAAWLIISLVILISTDRTQVNGKGGTLIKTNVGYSLVFLSLASVLVYLLFGFLG